MGLGLLVSIGGMFGLKGKIAGAVGALLLLVVVGGGLFGLKSCYDRSVVERAVTKANVKVLKKKGAADVKAAEQRGADNATIEQQREEIRDAVEKAPNPAAKRSARLCTILRQQAGGENRTSLPPECGPEKGR